MPDFIMIPAEFRVFEMKLQYLRYPLLEDGWATAWDLETIYIDVSAATEAANAATEAANAATEAANTATESVSAIAIATNENTTNIAALVGEMVALTSIVDAAQVDADNAGTAAAAAQTTANNAAAAAAAAQATANSASGGNGKLDYFNVFGDEFTWLAGTKQITITDLAPYNLFVGSLTNNARAQIRLPLRAGTWSFWIMTARRPDAANLLFKVDAAAPIAGLNLYKAAPAEYAYITSVTGVTVLDHTLVDLELWADGRTNPSSSYVLTVTKVWGLRTGA